MITPHDDTVSFAPFWDDVRRYRLSSLRFDLQAGVTVAVFAVPQAMAYAMLAGLPPVHGLYAAVVMSIVAALWGSSPFVNTGPTNSASLLTAAALLPLMHSGDLLALMFQFTLLVGLIRMAMGLLKLGWLVRFVPESAFLGFMAAIGVLIALGQLHYLLGVAASHHPSFPVRVLEVLGHAGSANLAALAVGLGTLLLLTALDRFAKVFPVALAVIALATGAAWLLGGVELVGDSTPVPSGLPQFVPYPLNFTLAGEMFPGAAAVALIGLIETVSIGQVLALKNRQRLNVNQEFFGQGWGQFVAAFFQGFPGSMSFTRSVMVEECGGRTRFANVYFGVFTALALVFLSDWLNRIPVAALAGLLLFVGAKLIDLRKVRQVWNTDRADFLVLALTFLVTIFIKVEYGLFVGIAAAMVIFLNRARDLRLYELVPQSHHGFEERAYTPDSHHEKSDVLVISLQGELFFGVAGALRSQLNEIVRVQEPKFLIVRTRRAHTIDYSCWNTIFQFAERFAEIGGKLYLSGVQPEFVRAIRETGMQKLLPREQRFEYTGVPMQAMHQTIAEVQRQLPEDAKLSPAWREHMRYVAEKLN